MPSWPTVIGGAVVVAVLLGALALVADQIGGPFGRVLLVVASTGLAWGTAAVALGAWAPRPSVAALAGAVVMAGAVSTYYGGAAVLGVRVASRTLLNAALIWGGLAVTAGPVLGVLGWYARRTSGRSRACAWGALAGLLLSQGIYLLFRSEGALFRPEAGPVQLILLASFAIPIAMVVIGSKRRYIGVGLALMITVGLLGAAVWSRVLEAI